MSETPILAAEEQQSTEMDAVENKILEHTEIERDVVQNDDEDLEDGEIDDDDDDEDVIITAVTNNINANNHTQNLNSTLKENHKLYSEDVVVTIDLLDDSGGQPPSPLPLPNATKVSKSKKPKPLEDDFAGSIEDALAKVLKKKGIEPVLPVIDSRNDQDQDHEASKQSSSRSSRRRKRKKQREEKEKHKSNTEKKKARYDSPDSTKGKIAEIEDDDLMEDYEMLNVRGGSPPPMAHLPPALMPQYKDQYDSADDSNYSYDSYDSTNDPGSPNENRNRKRRKKKDSRKRRNGGGGGGRNRDGDRQDKNNRRGESPDRQEPRKLELCKFYLMECCAKRDKCSYMHADFPCKYYYLGMDCTLKDDCKFSHGEPLTEQLRNILLKHLETAPKEILGNFKRISREQAIAQMTKRHEELCQKFNVQNIWSSFPNLPSNHNRRNNIDHQQQQHQNQQQQLQQQQQQQYNNQQQALQQQTMQHNSIHNNIPSLLDLDIRPPLGDLKDLSNNGGGICNEKQRKSRWCDNTGNDGLMGLNNRLINLQPPPNNAPSYLDLKNLTGILSEEHIKQLSDIGIVNLEQVNQLTVGQLNQIGLTIAEINEIQLNAKNMAQLGVPVGAGSLKLPTLDMGGAGATKQTEKSSPKTEKSSLYSFGDKSSSEENATSTTKSLLDECTNSNSNSNSCVVMVDYSQYLKDSNLPFERGDDDEKDDEQLVIDDGNTDNDESFSGTPTKSEHNDSKIPKESSSDRQEEDHPKPLSLLHKLQMPNLSNALRNPFSSIQSFNKQSDDISLQNDDLDVFKPSSDDVFKSKKKTFLGDTDSDDECYFASRGRRSRSVTPTRSGGSSTPEGGSPSPPSTNDFGQANKQRTSPKYERNTMYDYDVKRAVEEDASHAAKSIKADKDMRFMEGRSLDGGDIDLRLPFLPVTNYTPATEIDGSITSHLPMPYKVFEVDVQPPNYAALRKNSKSDQTSDPRLRRILGLPETPSTRTAVELSRSVRKLSNTIASPESSDGASPKYYTPSMSSLCTEDRSRRDSIHKSSQPVSSGGGGGGGGGAPQLRLDPRRAARQATETASSAISQKNSSATTTTSPNNANKQNVEIRNYLQNSDWYKNLNSKFKIMVNQQLALVSTELKKFHQDPSPNKIFDISFIVNNSTLQQILTNLGVYIDDNGEVAHIDGDEETDERTADGGGMQQQNAENKTDIVLPNLSQPPPMQSQQQQQLDFLRAPPPNIFSQNVQNVQQFTTPPPNARPSLLGLPPGTQNAPRNPFNPFAGNVPPVPFVAAPSLLGPGPGGVPVLNAPIAFGNFAMPQQQIQQRNFANSRNNNQLRNQRQRRNNFNSSSGKI